MNRSHYPFPRGIGQLYEFTEPHIASEVPAGGEVLDVGCGEGTLVPLLLAAGAKRVVAFDISPEIIEVASQKHPGAEYLVGDAEDEQFTGRLGQYDLVLMRNAFHHFQEKERFVRLVPSLLKKDGTFLLIDLDYESNFVLWGVLATHLRFFFTHDPRDSIKLLAKTRMFLGKAMREHRRLDRRLLKQQGWFKATAIEGRLKKIHPRIAYRRIGEILRHGGAYIARLRKVEIAS